MTKGIRRVYKALFKLNLYLVIYLIIYSFNNTENDARIISMEDFLENMDEFLDRVDASERILVRRGSQIYAILRVE